MGDEKKRVEEEEWESQLSSCKKLERDAALVRLEEQVKRMESSAGEACVEGVAWRMVGRVEGGEGEGEEQWESIQGCLAGLNLILKNTNLINRPNKVAEKVLELCLRFLSHDETRVRLTAAETVGTLCRLRGTSIYVASESQIKDLITDNLSRKLPKDSSIMEEKLMQKLVYSQPEESGVDVEQIYHDTAGWHALETSLKCLQWVVEGCGERFRPFVSPSLLSLLFHTLSHTNRFVRETGFYLLGSLIMAGGKNVEGVENTMFEGGVEVSGWLRKGLGDNWSQVRMAASVATRNFLNVASDYHNFESLLGCLVPPMCLNRYYLAEGVRLYSQETWRQASKGKGITLVSDYIEEVVSYYIEQTQADNHAVREAACHAIAELSVKIEKEKLTNLVESLLDALLHCFQDESWPVRDAACIASARFLSAFPMPGENSGLKFQENVLPLFWTQLEDCIPSVRQGAAEGLASLTAAYGSLVVDWVLPRLTQGLGKIKEQSADSEESQGPAFPGLSSGPAVFGVAKQIRANDPALHTGQQMFSCGSLAPKMGKGGGCMDEQFRRPPVPWETTEGCLQLLAELSSQPQLGSTLSALLPLVIQASYCRTFLNHVKFLETLCIRLPQIAENLGKRHFKPHLQEFLEPVFYSMTCGCELTQVAAEGCLRKLADIFGPSIIRGRVGMMENVEFAHLYDRVVRIPVPM